MGTQSSAIRILPSAAAADGENGLAYSSLAEAGEAARPFMSKIMRAM
jgi:hypothetical protein